MRLLKCWGGLDCTYTNKQSILWENRPKSSAKPRTDKYGIYLHGCVSCAQIKPQLLLFLLLAELTVLLAVVLPSSVILHHYDPERELRTVPLPHPYHWGCALLGSCTSENKEKQLTEAGVRVKDMPLKKTQCLPRMKNVYFGGENSIQVLQCWALPLGDALLGKEGPKLLVMSNISYSSKSDFPFLSQLGIRVTSPTWVESVVQILQGETERKIGLSIREFPGEKKK